MENIHLLKKAIDTINGFSDNLNKYGKFLKERDEELYNRISEFDFEYREFITKVLKFAHRTNETMKYVQKLTTTNLYEGVVFLLNLLTKDNLSDLVKEANRLQREAKDLHSNLSLGKFVKSLKWWEILVAGLAAIGTIALTIVILPFATGVEIVIGAGIVIGVVGGIVGTAILKLAKNGLTEQKILKIKLKLEKIQEQMKKVALNLTDIEGKNAALEDLKDRILGLDSITKKVMEESIGETIGSIKSSCEGLITYCSECY